jgi:hypothetical protein
MGSLLTLLAAAMPLVCPAKELAVLVLLPVWAWRVVLGAGIGPAGADVLDPPLPLPPGEVPEGLLLVPEQELVKETAKESTRMNAAMETTFEAELMPAQIPQSPRLVAQKIELLTILTAGLDVRRAVYLCSLELLGNR